MGVENVIGGYALEEVIDLGPLNEGEVATILSYNRDGDLLYEQQLPVQLTERNATITVSGDNMRQNSFIFEGELEVASSEPNHTLGIQQFEYTSDGLSFYGNTGELLWRIDGYEGAVVQGTNSAEYRINLGSSDLLQSPEYRTDLDSWHTFCEGEWTSGADDEEQPDIKDERGGALDEFLDGFKPQKTTPERSDGQK